MENDIKKLLDRLLLTPRAEGDEPTNSTSPVAATGDDAAAAASEGDSGSDLDGGADLGNLTDDDRVRESGVLVAALSSRPSNIGELPDVCFKKCDELVFPPEHGLTISTKGQHTCYFCLTFIDCQFESAGMTTFAGCQLNFVTFEGCTFKGVNQFINIIGDGLCYTKCTFDNHWEANLRYDSDKHLVSLTFEGTRHNGNLGQSEADWRSDLVKEQEREFGSWSKHPRVPWGVHTEDEDGMWKSAGRGLVVKENREHEFYREVYFINCTFDPNKPTIFDNCVLDGVTFKDCSFSGSRLENFYAKGLKATNCTFDDCQYVNVARPDHEVLNGLKRSGTRNIGASMPSRLTEKLREKRTQKPWSLTDVEETHNAHYTYKPAKGIEIKENSGLSAPHQKKENQPPGNPPKEWGVATMGKGKGRADAPGDESKQSASSTPDESKESVSSTPDAPADTPARAVARTIFKTFNFEEDPETREEKDVTDMDLPSVTRGARRRRHYRQYNIPGVPHCHSIDGQNGGK